MKQMNIIICIMFCCMVASAQAKGRISPQDQQEFKGYTIRILPAAGLGYGYDILKGNELIIHQSYNPFTLSPRGLTKKEDVYKLAQWQIQHLSNRAVIQGQMQDDHASLKLPSSVRNKMALQGASGQMINQPVSPKVAEELHIDFRH